MNVHIIQTTDLTLVKSFSIQPDIFYRISEDGMTPQDYQPNQQSLWLLAVMDFTIIGVCEVVLNNSTTVTIHPMIAQKYRAHYGRHTIDAFIKWIPQQAPSVKKIMAYVPYCFSKTKNCALKIGFEVEGTSKKSIMKNDILQDQWILGLCIDPSKEERNECYN